MPVLLSQSTLKALRLGRQSRRARDPERLHTLREPPALPAHAVSGCLSASYPRKPPFWKSVKSARRMRASLPIPTTSRPSPSYFAPAISGSARDTIPRFSLPTPFAHQDVLTWKETPQPFRCLSGTPSLRLEADPIAEGYWLLPCKNQSRLVRCRLAWQTRAQIPRSPMQPLLCQASIGTRQV